ncbi:hypothetical protein [Mycobacterium hubeiense]|uniref:hypothetical protein n=1 Tax=Mycobacterium hubeiense TaxID=1867256 RepID=UPI000C7F775E|nr:hypothetical protein [Mycobacterium sp. QGD 101]
MGDHQPFIGSVAIANGLLKKHQLRAHFRALFPDVYIAEDVALTLGTRAHAGWLWSRRQGVIAGLTASAMHGAQWVDDLLPIELVWSNARAPRGLRTHDWTLYTEERCLVASLPVTTVERTAFDIGRRGRLDEAVARLDALGNATGFKIDDVLAVAERHPGARGLRQLRAGLDLYDAGAESPKETWLRLLLIRAGYPRPQTQIPVWSPDGRRKYRIDMGWADIKVGVEYEGDHHRVDKPRYDYDITRYEDLNFLRWKMIRVVGRDREPAILARVERAWASRLR